MLGEFVHCPLPAGVDYSLGDVLLDVLAPRGVPIYGGFPVGHGARNLSWVLGRTVEIRESVLQR